MSELMKARNNGQDFRRQLLATVSALALLASIYGTGEAEAADQDADHPTVWIELGGQLEQMQGGQEAFAPPFVANMPNTFFSPLSVQKPLQFSYGAEGAISFQPQESDWVFTASVRFGRSNGARQMHQQTPNVKVPAHITFSGKYYNLGTKYPTLHRKFEDAAAKQSETHAVLDFQAGKDVGLGMFGNRGSSVFSAGVRYAQFSSKMNVSLHAMPDLHYPSKPISSIPAFVAFTNASIHFHDYAAMMTNQRSFRGLGPSLAWKASAPFVGNSDRGEITLDWGANAAVLFGRQKARGHHQTTSQTYYKNNWQGNRSGPGHFVNRTLFSQANGNSYFTGGATGHRNNAAGFNRMRTVVVPNIGGMVGLSFRHADEKISLGYRADFFFGAMDGGIDMAKKENRSFYGPYATISIGIGG